MYKQLISILLAGLFIIVGAGISGCEAKVAEKTGQSMEHKADTKTTQTGDMKLDEPETQRSDQVASDVIKAADFSLNGIDGESIKLSDYNGKVMILDFWATWCPPCVREIPHFNELAREYAEKGLVVLGISVDKGGASVVKKFKENNPITYPVAMVDKNMYSLYQSFLPAEMQGGIPFTFVIDRAGNIREHFVGYRAKSVFVDAIKPLL